VINVGPYRVSAAFEVVVLDAMSATELAADIDALRQRLRSDKRIASLTVTPTLIPSA
jgi:hypothetical protein